MGSWRGIPVNRIKQCVHCSKIIYRTSKNTKTFNKIKFCDRKCWKTWFRKNNHPQWNPNKIHYCINCKTLVSKRSTGLCADCRNKKGKAPDWLAKLRLSKRISQQKRRTKYMKGAFTKQDWIDITKKWENKCALCHILKKLTIDHIIPLSKGGMHTKENIQPLCGNCNSSKGSKLLVPLTHES